MKAIHNATVWTYRWAGAVTNHEDNNFWKQFTTYEKVSSEIPKLWLITKIIIFESNSQLNTAGQYLDVGCD